MCQTVGILESLRRSDWPEVTVRRRVFPTFLELFRCPLSPFRHIRITAAPSRRHNRYTQRVPESRPLSISISQGPDIEEVIV